MLTVIALLLAGGGSVWAAAMIDGAHIRKHSIPADRLVDHSVTAKQLGKPPGFTRLKLFSPWIDYSTLPGSTSVTPVGFYLDREGFVHLQGAVQGDTSKNQNVVGQLPAGARPAGGSGDCRVFPIVENSQNSFVLICGDGAMYVGGPSSEWGHVSLDGVTFRHGV